MNTLILERCVLCGYPVRKPGELLCIRHDVQALITLGYYRMMTKGLPKAIEKGTAQRLKRR